jgi:hypothetical protein
VLIFESQAQRWELRKRTGRGREGRREEKGGGERRGREGREGNQNKPHVIKAEKRKAARVTEKGHYSWHQRLTPVILAIKGQLSQEAEIRRTAV